MEKKKKSKHERFENINGSNIDYFNLKINAMLEARPGFVEHSRKNNQLNYGLCIHHLKEYCSRTKKIILCALVKMEIMYKVDWNQSNEPIINKLSKLRTE